MTVFKRIISQVVRKQHLCVSAYKANDGVYKHARDCALSRAALCARCVHGHPRCAVTAQITRSATSVVFTADWNSKSTLFLLVSRLKLNGVMNLVIDLISRFVSHVFVYFFKSVLIRYPDLLHTDI